MKWLKEDRVLLIAVVMWLIALAFAWFTSPVVAAIREGLA